MSLVVKFESIRLGFRRETRFCPESRSLTRVVSTAHGRR